MINILPFIDLLISGVKSVQKCGGCWVFDRTITKIDFDQIP
jgi:hypothetical protein